MRTQHLYPQPSKIGDFPKVVPRPGDTRYISVGVMGRQCVKCRRKKPIKGGRCRGPVPGTGFVCADCSKAGPE